MSQKTKSILTRFAKGFVAGADTSMVAVPLVAPVDWTGFLPILNSLAMALVFGGISGLLLALQKWASWQD
jgi:hypothetical protein